MNNAHILWTLLEPYEHVLANGKQSLKRGSFWRWPAALRYLHIYSQPHMSMTITHISNTCISILLLGQSAGHWTGTHPVMKLGRLIGALSTIVHGITARVPSVQESLDIIHRVASIHLSHFIGEGHHWEQHILKMNTTLCQSSYHIALFTTRSRQCH